jgi:beta-barrel assembly-enhancing protease
MISRRAMTAHSKKNNPGRAAKFLCAALLALAACSSAPLAPISQDGFRPEEDESRIWQESRELQARFERSGLVYLDATMIIYLNRVGSKLLPPAAAKHMSFEIKVLKHPVPNAFALPHGTLYIHTGMLARMENEAQLAAVVSHEVVHIIRRHTLLTFRSVKQAAGIASTLAVIGAPAGLPGLGVVILGSIGALAAVSGYSQSLEEEADREGLRLAVDAGYDPGEAIKVIDNVKRYVEQEEIKEPFFFSTHPRLEERKASYQRLVDSVYRGRAGRHGKDEFTSAFAAAMLENALLETVRGRYSVAQESIENCIRWEPDNSKAHLALAELLRQRGLESDQARAETEYQLTIDLQPQLAGAHRGIGLLYFKSGRTELAANHLKIYLALTPAAKDRAYIEQYLREIESAKGRP